MCIIENNPTRFSIQDIVLLEGFKFQTESIVVNTGYVSYQHVMIVVDFERLKLHVKRS